MTTDTREKRCPKCQHPMMEGPLSVRNPRDPDGPRITAAWWCANCHHSIEPGIPSEQLLALGNYRASPEMDMLEWRIVLQALVCTGHVEVAESLVQALMQVKTSPSMPAGLFDLVTEIER